MAKQRFSLGLDLTECILDCSIELCDSSATSAQDSSPLVHYKPQNSFEMDESLGILTPDQMLEFLDSNATNAILDLPLNLPSKLPMHKCRIDQTPSPEELPLDPVGVKTFDEDVAGTSVMSASNAGVDHQLSESYTKTDPMSKSSASKVSNSFITSVTSIASLDNGYQGDGEMSRPASRGGGGGGDNSPLNVRRAINDRRKKQLDASFECPKDNENIPILRRDPMTDSDFFTESDADDVFHRGDRRVQIIDGHLYNGQGVDLFIEDRRQNELLSSGMDSSGIYTDGENNRAEDEQQSMSPSNQIDSDMSPDGSTDTIKSSSEYNNIQNIGETNTNLIVKPMTSSLTQQQTTVAAAAATAPAETTLSDEACRLAPVLAVAAAAAVTAQQTSNDSTSSAINGIGTTTATRENGRDRNVISSDVSSSSLSNGTAVNSAASCIPNINSTVSVSTCVTEKSTKTATTTSIKCANNPTAAIKAKKSSSNRKQSKHDTTNATPKKHDMSSKQKTLNGKVQRTNRNESMENGATTVANNNANNNIKAAATMVQHVRKVTPNKWEKVMNTIAQNKAAAVVNHKNYSQVKSKVTSGLTGKRASLSAHGTLKSASTNDQSSASSSLSSLAQHALATVNDDTNDKITTKITTAALLPLSRQSTYGAVAKRFATIYLFFFFFFFLFQTQIFVLF